MKKFLFLVLIPFSLHAQLVPQSQIGITIVGNGITTFIVSWIGTDGKIHSDSLSINAAPRPLASVSVVNGPNNSWLPNWKVGDVFCLNAIGRDSSGVVIKGVNFTYTSSDTTVAKVITNATCPSGQAVKIP